MIILMYRRHTSNVRHRLRAMQVSPWRYDTCLKRHFQRFGRPTSETYLTLKPCIDHAVQPSRGRRPNIAILVTPMGNAHHPPRSSRRRLMPSLVTATPRYCHGGIVPLPTISVSDSTRDICMSRPLKGARPAPVAVARLLSRVCEEGKTPLEWDMLSYALLPRPCLQDGEWDVHRPQQSRYLVERHIPRHLHARSTLPLYIHHRQPHASNSRHGQQMRPQRSLGNK
ncbi:uncharacterized protein C8Q71DRAFT_280055 [Rhodofomes roseus]|uniref:Uncharacterized protein n=1 Tax=Rhodofomes roseus TaxID=34475 RepID=A0ABQ8K519_9APHY|nr:uncharacterized protein C8Q71DRAFT_280055 [Rhodofomes roseus]KAH9832061.1 hypothetical protein C8Q71DRAFT_280055 [Rhodofomes roseus]